MYLDIFYIPHNSYTKHFFTGVLYLLYLVFIQRTFYLRMQKRFHVYIFNHQIIWWIIRRFALCALHTHFCKLYFRQKNRTISKCGYCFRDFITVFKHLLDYFYVSVVQFRVWAPKSVEKSTFFIFIRIDFWLCFHKFYTAIISIAVQL